MQNADKKPKNGKHRGFLYALRRVLRAALIAAAMLVAAFLLFFAVKLLNLNQWENFDPEKILGAPQTLILYDGNDAEVIRLHAKEDRVYKSINNIPDHVQKAFISAEDARFYEHSGIDFIRVAGALWADIKAMSFVEGASTITQQLIKLSHLTSEKTLSRKLEEAVLAMQMERIYSKDEILEMYLNYVYFGAGCYGIEAAALNYFGVSAEELSIAQAADLAGILKSPSTYAPHLNKEASLKRRNTVLRLMYEYGYISDEQREAATAEPIILAEKEAQHRGYYIDEVLKEAQEMLDMDMDELLCGGFRIYTAMDTRLQALCEETLNNAELYPENAEACQAAIAIQQPKTGYVLAMVGGRGAAGAMAFNRASDMRRQPGSLIKPVLVYAPALERLGYTAATMLMDSPTTFGDYSPQNAGGKYYGWVTLREAVKKSLNVPAVQVLSELSVETGKDFAKSVGISFDESDTSLTLALGGFSYGVSPLEMAAAYASFASLGEYRESTLIRYITDASGQVLYEHEDEPVRVMSEGNAYVLTSMLQSVVSEGTGKRLGELNIALAGKTGTVGESNGNRDAWMAVYNTDYSACVWMGYDSAHEGTLPSSATGGKYPAMMLYNIFSDIYADMPAPEFEIPASVETVKLDGHTLKNEHRTVLANAFTPKESIVSEVFVSGTAPNEATEYWTVPKAIKKLRVSMDTDGYPVISFETTERGMNYCIYRIFEGESELIGHISGEGKLSYKDTAAPCGTLEYAVAAEHPELKVLGKLMQGPLSTSVSINIVKTIQDENTSVPELILEDTEFFDDDYDIDPTA